MTAVSETSAIVETQASWRAERMLRFIIFPARQWVFFSELIATYAWLRLVFLAAAILVVGSGVVWLVFDANWSYLAEQNLAPPIMAVVIFIIAVLTILVKKILDATKAPHYCSNCLDIITAQKLRRPEESGPHKIRTRKE